MEVFCGGKWHTIDAKICKRTAKTGHRNAHYQNNLMHWVERLMLAGFCLIVTIGCSTPIDSAIADRASELSSGYSRQVSELAEKQQQALTEIAATRAENHFHAERILEKLDTLEASLVRSEPQPGTEVIQSPSEPQEKSPLATPSSEATPAVRLYVTHADFYCPPCEALKAAVNRGEFAGFEVINSESFPGLRSYPAIRFQDPSGQWKVIYGYDGNTVATLHKLTSPQQTVVPSQPIVTQSAMNHGDLVALHNQLHGGGQWTWPGDLATHLREVHGVQTGGQPVGAIFPVSRQSPIVNSRPVVRFVPQRVSYTQRSRTKVRKSCPPSGCP